MWPKRIWIGALALAVPVHAHAQEDDVEIVVAATSDAAAPVAESVTESVAGTETATELVTESESAAVTATESVTEPESESATESVTESAVVTESAAPSPIESTLQTILSGLHASAWMQVQYEGSQLSEDAVIQGGIFLNQDRFSLRRGRVRLEGRWDWIELDLEIDISTTRGVFAGPRRATVGAAYREGTTLARVRAGLTEIPFGHEVRLSQREMPFAERTQGSLAFFRGPVDVGLRADGSLGPFRYDVAAMSGTPLDDRAGQSGIDPVSTPELVGRVGADAELSSDVSLAGGVSLLWGRGFHAGSDAEKGRLEWRDLNESGTLDTGEIIAVPGRAATPSYTFEHWAVGADLAFSARTFLGRTLFFGEAVIAQNLDRALFVADPIALGADIRELAFYGALVQDLFDWGLVGFRYDYYDPNSDLLDQRRGISVPRNATLHTLSPLVGLRLPAGLIPDVSARVIFQYDAIFDALGRDARGVPTDLANDHFTIRVQGEFGP